MSTTHPHNHINMPPTSAEERIVRQFTPMPPEYVFVQKGDVYITKNCRKLTRAESKPIYIVRSDKKRTLGIRVPRSVYNQVVADNTATAGTRAEKVRRKDQNLEDKMKAELLSCFPRVPREHVPLILRHTLQKRSRRVGRSKEKPLNQVVELAIRAYIRHRLTDYDKLLRKGVDREKARRLIQDSVDEKIKQWGGSVERSSLCKSNRKSGREQHQDSRAQSLRTSGSQVRGSELRTSSIRCTSNPHKTIPAVVGTSRRGTIPITPRSIEQQSGKATKKSLAFRPREGVRGTVADDKMVIVISDDDDFMDVDVAEIETDSFDDSDESYQDD